jgi:hypothetical protein
MTKPTIATLVVLGVIALAALVVYANRPPDPLKFDAADILQGTTEDGIFSDDAIDMVVEELRAIHAEAPELREMQPHGARASSMIMIKLTDEAGAIFDDGVPLVRRPEMSSRYVLGLLARWLRNDTWAPERFTLYGCGGLGIKDFDALCKTLPVRSVTLLRGMSLLSSTDLLLEFSEPIDRKLARRFEALPSVKSAASDAPLGGGDSISRKESEGVIGYEFRHGWGDCPAGCLSHESYCFELRRTDDGIRVDRVSELDGKQCVSPSSFRSHGF